jgi:hypothetical protein
MISYAGDGFIVALAICKILLYISAIILYALLIYVVNKMARIYTNDKLIVDAIYLYLQSIK